MKQLSIRSAISQFWNRWSSFLKFSHMLYSQWPIWSMCLKEDTSSAELMAKDVLTKFKSWPKPIVCDWPILWLDGYFGFDERPFGSFLWAAVSLIRYLGKLEQDITLVNGNSRFRLEIELNVEESGCTTKWHKFGSHESQNTSESSIPDHS